MRHILRQTALTLASFAFLYALIGGLSFLVFPDPARGARDFQAADHTLFMTVPKYVFLGRSILDGLGNKVLLVGASNTGVGFIQTSMQSKLPCAQISNLGMGGANISEVKQVIDLVHETQGTREHGLNTFVIGVWYGMFVDSETRYADPDRPRGETDLDIERYRYGFYRRTPDGPVAVLPPRWLDAGVLALRPLLLVEKAAREARAGVNLLLTGRRSAQRTEAEREAVVMSDAEKRKRSTIGRKAWGSRARSPMPRSLCSGAQSRGYLLPERRLRSSTFRSPLGIGMRVHIKETTNRKFRSCPRSSRVGRISSSCQ